MLSQELIAEVVASQREVFLKKKLGVEREDLATLKIYENFAHVITGIRRSGKSTLLLQLLRRDFDSAFFLNFEDPRLVGFQTDDFRRLDEVIRHQKSRVLFFDEIQALENWELYVRQKLDEDFQVVVTGSNATLLSKELGTKLTGRHLSTELFPFSYREFLAYKKWEASDKNARKYLDLGGFPEYLKTNVSNVLRQLLDDVLYRDIAVRFGIRDVLSLRKLAVFLLSNIGKPASATNLAKSLDIKATSTVLEYFSHLENAYLVQFVPRFSYSLKQQIRNPRKVYAIDLGLHAQNSVNFSDDLGRKLENLVYLHLRRNHSEIYYFSENKECDFVVVEKEKPVHLIQVCSKLTQDNLERELSGAFEALEFFKKHEAILVTLNQTDRFVRDGRIVSVMSLNDFLINIV